MLCPLCFDQHPDDCPGCEGGDWKVEHVPSARERELFAEFLVVYDFAREFAQWPESGGIRSQSAWLAGAFLFFADLQEAQRRVDKKKAKDAADRKARIDRQKSR